MCINLRLGSLEHDVFKDEPRLNVAACMWVKLYVLDESLGCGHSLEETIKFFIRAVSHLCADDKFRRYANVVYEAAIYT